MSHEIRTPMNAIIGFSEVLLMDTGIKNKTRKQASTILQSAKSLLNIINDILDISKLESGKFSLEEIAFHLPNALAEALRTVEYQADEKNLKLSLTIDNSLENHYIGDPTRLRQVILNLVSNAIKFTEKGFVKVQVEPDPLDENTLLFRVLDSGIGMSEKQCKHIFEPFTQADTSTTRRFGGTGLGTSICKQIVELMSGEITVRSQLGIGSEFSFTYSMEKAPEEMDCLYDDSNVSHDAYVSPRAFNILLAEDIETNAQLVTLRLEHLGHKITWVKNGLEALEAYQEHNFDLILMDVMMPKMDGLEATEKIRLTEKDKQKPILIMALTASVMREDHQRCRDAGMNRVEAKPIDFKRLLQDIEELVPKDLGQKTTLHNIDLADNIYIDFGPVEHCIDTAEAISIWQDAWVYAQALQKFADEHEHDAINIRQDLQVDTENNQTAKLIAHTLKGLAGNLQFKEITELSIEIDNALKSGQLDQVRSRLDNLHRELQRAVIAIRQLELPDSSSQTPMAQYDPDLVTILLKKLSDSLLELNPDHATPIMSEIEMQLSCNELHSIQQAIDSFDFDQAQISIQKLAEELELNID
jgi:two-component system sensor histidine kinase EvgS